MISQVIRIGPFQPPDMILELPNEDQKRGENQKKNNFSDTHQVMTAKCSLLFLWGNSKFQVYIGKVASNFQRNRAVSMAYFPSNISFNFSDEVTNETCF